MNGDDKVSVKHNLKNSRSQSNPVENFLPKVVKEKYLYSCVSKTQHGLELFLILLFFLKLYNISMKAALADRKKVRV